MDVVKAFHRRHTKYNMAEKRVILQTTNKNRLRMTQQKLNMQEKSFISSTQIDKRLFLNKHAKFAQLRIKERGDTKPSARRNLPRIVGANAPVNLTQSKGDPTMAVASVDLRVSGQQNEMDMAFSSVKKPATEGQRSPLLLPRHTASHDNQFRRTKNKSTGGLDGLSRTAECEAAQRHGKVRSKQYMVDESFKTTMKKDSVVNDIIGYNGKERKKRKAAEKVAPVENKDTRVIIGSSKVMKNVQNTSATKLKISMEHPPIVSAKTSTNASKTKGIDRKSEKIIFMINDKVEDSHRKQDLNLNNSQKKRTASCNRTTSTPTRSDSSTPLPALRILRKGSYCDVKTFTSGRVLDLLAKEDPVEETKDKLSLDIESGMLKYCRYLRTSMSDQEDIPEKYQPSKNIIVGHTKMFSSL